MTRGRKRRHDPSIPAHIDQARIPVGIWWDASGRGRWFVHDVDAEGRKKRRTVATYRARLSDLHAIDEQRRGVDSTSLAWLLEQFHASTQFGELAPGTRAHYEYVRRVVNEFQTKAGPKLGQVRFAQMSRPVVQKLVDRIGATHPTKANHVLRYLRRVFRWGQNRIGACTDNPAAGVEQATERRLRRLPARELLARVTAFALERGKRKPRTEGSCAPYLWIVTELAYLLRLRGIEVITLTDAHAGDVGVQTNRRKGSRDTVFRWSPRLRAAWDAAIALRTSTWSRTSRPVPMRPEDRVIVVAEDGGALKRSSLDTAWQRLMHLAMREGAGAEGKEPLITAAERFGLHDCKRRGITDFPGTRHERADASGHKSPQMMDVYDHSIPVVDSESAG